MSEAVDCSADGNVVVGNAQFDIAAGNSITDGWRWTQSTGMVALGFSKESNARVVAVSDDGKTVLGNFTPDGDARQAFVWTAATGPVPVGTIGGLPNQMAALSGDGSTAFGWTNNEAARWTAEDGLVNLAPPAGASQSALFASSHDGSVAVGWARRTGASLEEAILWDETSGSRFLLDALEDEYGLDLTGWYLFAPRDISSDGKTIIGEGTNPIGVSTFWVAVLGDRVAATCVDTLDNDGDEFVDFPNDPGCKAPKGIREDPQCQDGLNNDLAQDSGIDFDGGASVNLGVPLGPADPQCPAAWDNRESRCGLGAELVLLVPILMARRRRLNF
jgi:uncharacterized membrane protein